MTLGSQVQSSFECSIATGKILERFFDPTIATHNDEELDEPIDINEYNRFWFNGRTIVRNWIESFDSKVRLAIVSNPTDKTILKPLTEEIYRIAAHFDGTYCNFGLFMPDYKELKKNSLFRVSKNTTSFTHRLKVAEEILTDIVFKEKLNLDVFKDNHKLPNEEGNVIIATHYYTDCLNKTVGSLIESHTGTIRKRETLGIKYQGDPLKVSTLPFQEKLLYILGDNKLWKGVSAKERRELIDQLVSKKVTIGATKGRVKAVVGRTNIKDIYNKLVEIY